MKKISIILIAVLLLLGTGFSSIETDNPLIFTGVVYAKKIPLLAESKIDFKPSKAIIYKAEVSKGQTHSDEFISEYSMVTEDNGDGTYTKRPELTLNFRSSQYSTRDVANSFKNIISPHKASAKNTIGLPNKLNFYLGFNLSFLYDGNSYLCNLVVGSEGSGNKLWIGSPHQKDDVDCEGSSCKLSIFVECKDHNNNKETFQIRIAWYQDNLIYVGIPS